jgi:hypothetical protein
MADIFGRFRRRKATANRSPPNAEQIGLDNKNIQTPSEKQKISGVPVVYSTGSKTSRDHDPELATDQTTTDEESVVDEDLKDIPVEVRNTVSFEDDPNLPTITFRYFLLTFIFVAPGAFLYQMVRPTPMRHTKKPR